MSVKNIVYVHETFYRKHRDMGIDLLRSRGYKVELWSTYKIKYRNILTIPRDVLDEEVVYLNTKLEIIERLKKKNLSQTVFFFTTTAHRGGIEDFIRICICLMGGKYCNFIYEFFPVGVIGSRKKQTWKDTIKELYSNNVTVIMQRIIKKWCQPTYCFVTTKKGTQSLLTEWEQKCAIPIHNKDFDEFIISKREQKIISEKYIVFIDDDLVNAEDFRKGNVETVYPTPQIYYENINKFFDMLENLYHLPIKVAAHPKSEYCGSEFNGREIVYYRTEELIREAKLVITHASIAISYIILYHKPFIFMVDKYIKHHMIWKYLYFPVIKELKIKTFDFINGNFNLEYINNYGTNYDKFQKKYIKEIPDEGKLFYEIVDQYLRGI